MFDTPLWPHQQAGRDGVLDAVAAGSRRICLTSPTGMGKTRIVAELIRDWLQKDLRVAVYSNRRLLIDQLSEVFDNFGFEHGIRAAGHQDRRELPLQISSIQTEGARVIRSARWQLHDAQRAIFDEVHLFNNPTAREVMARHLAAGAVNVGVTATPVGLGELFEDLVVAGTTSEGRKCGALVPAYHYGPDEPDLSKIGKVRLGEDLSKPQLKKAFPPTQALFARVFEWWKRLNPDARPTILFAPGVAESVWFAEEFRKRGVSAAHIDGEDIWVDGETYQSTRAGRADLLEDSRDGRVQVLCNRFVCLDAETEVLTDQGWVGIAEMATGHRVANWDAGRVYFEAPNRVVRRAREPGERMVVLETPRRSIRITASHELLYRTTQDGDFLKDRADALADRAVAVPVSGHAAPLPVTVEQPAGVKNPARRITANAFLLRRRGFSPAAARAEAATRLAQKAALRYKQPHELTEEECEFIGFWIGDGNRNRLQSGGVEYRLSQSADSANIVARIDHLCRSVGSHFVRRARTVGGRQHVLWSLPRGTGFGPQRRPGLFHVEPYLCKDGTPLFWGLGERQLDALLRGLWMADGCPHNDSTAPPDGFSVCGINRPLFDLLQAVAVCRGYRASVRSYRNGPHATVPLLMLSLTKTDEHRMTKYRLRFEEGWRAEEVWCVTTRSGNIITRRNGSVTVMGNCREGIDCPWLEHSIFATVFGSVQSFLQSGGRLLRASPSTSKTRATIQDHGGNYWRHGSLNADRTWNLSLTASMVSGMREDRLRNKEEMEPVRCPQCAQILATTRCPCGFTVDPRKKSRPVVMSDGSLKEHFGDIYRPRVVQFKPDTTARWMKCYYRARNTPGMTWRQAEGLFFAENGYFPPQNLPFMPTEGRWWFRSVASTPKEKLHS